MTTNAHHNPRSTRLLLNAAGIDTALLDIVPASHAVLITALPSDDAAAARLITDVHVVLHLAKLDATRRSPRVIRLNNPRRRR